ncbi:hypothetical protein SU48_04325 [Deinococcus puniceus]|uniref:SCP domain-containing protein n=1 Tax=Deinococcus puniceus TaxID=1182568 RepID=A0A172T810_9DEIO|nr:hypothetical protein SU48_04325 [Deinococcus puniceus]
MPALPPVPAAAPSRAESELLALVNEFRTSGTLYGDASLRVGTCAAAFSPRPPLGSAAPLAAAAQSHANYLGFNPYSGHSEVGGRPYFTGIGPAERLQVAHLPNAFAGLWPHLAAWGETAAYGYPTARSVLAAWLASPLHCAVLMNPEMTHVGVAYMDSSAAINHHVWVQVFAAYH